MLIAVFVGTFIFLMFIGVPAGFAMGSTSLISAFLLWGIDSLPIEIFAQRLVGGVNSFTTLAIPLFLLAGQLMNGGSITTRIFNFANSCVGHLPGGLGHVNVLGSIIFSGMSGTAAADAAGLGAMEIKAMVDNGYDIDFSVAVTGASSLIGPIIPPSVPLVMYGVLANVSVGQLFIGGIIPGLLMGVSMSVLVIFYSIKRNYPRGERITIRQFFINLREAVLPLFCPALIIGGIWTGVFTPTEAAAVAVTYAILLNFIYRDISPGQVWSICKNVVIDSASILFIMGCVSVYGYVLIRTRIPMLLAQAVFGITTNPFGIILILIVFLLIIGCFMSTTESIILFVPIFLPLLTQANIDLLFFGVIMAMTLMIGQLTPPFGIVLFILTKVSKIGFDRVVRAVLPFSIPVLAVILLCVFFPFFITFLPSLMG
jgi:tripartite ATP-independent transporter DctM subunit